MGEVMSGTERVRIINLDNGSATTLAEALGRMLPQMRPNPVKVNLPGGESSKPAPEKKEPEKNGAPPEKGSALRGPARLLAFTPARLTPPPLAIACLHEHSERR